LIETHSITLLGDFLVKYRVTRSKGQSPKLSGDFIEEAIPDPIPNSEVKLFGADGTAWGICVGE
jgi:hypothetical protein